jgi:hypothetical protein
MVSRCAKAVEYWRKGARDDVKIALELVFCETLRAARRLGVDLAAEVEAKDRHNAGRPKLHGKTESLG